MTGTYQKVEDQFCPTRETLLLKVKNRDDEKSWEDFVHYYKAFIFTVCKKMNVNHHDSEEISQKVLLKLWHKLPDFKYSPGGRFRGWLCMVTGNTVKDFFRKESRLSDKAQAVKESPLTSMKQTEQPEINNMMLEEWEKHITSLAFETVEQSFTQRVLDIFIDSNNGLSADELSKKYELTVNTIYKHCQRVRVKLHSEIRRLHFELS